MTRLLTDDFCKILLAQTRMELGAKPEERIDKRYYTTENKGRQYLAPNNLYYTSHCGYCAEAKYLEDIYKDKETTSVTNQASPGNFKDMTHQQVVDMADSLGVTYYITGNQKIDRMNMILGIKAVGKQYAVTYNSPMKLPQDIKDQSKQFVGQHRKIRVQSVTVTGVIQEDGAGEFYVMHKGFKAYVRPYLIGKDAADLWTIDKF